MGGLVFWFLFADFLCVTLVPRRHFRVTMALRHQLLVSLYFPWCLFVLSFLSFSTMQHFNSRIKRIILLCKLLILRTLTLYCIFPSLVTEALSSTSCSVMVLCAIYSGTARVNYSVFPFSFQTLSLYNLLSIKWEGRNSSVIGWMLPFPQYSYTEALTASEIEIGVRGCFQKDKVLRVGFGSDKIGVFPIRDTSQLGLSVRVEKLCTNQGDTLKKSR